MTTNQIDGSPVVVDMNGLPEMQSAVDTALNKRNPRGFRQSLSSALGALSVNVSNRIFFSLNRPITKASNESRASQEIKPTISGGARAPQEGKPDSCVIFIPSD